ncbi:MAG: glycosyltransferase family 4 protein [Candidatus Zixiibacteriota bacterium]
MIKVLHIDTGLTFRGGQRQVALLINRLAQFDIRQYLACPDKSPLVDKTYYSVDKRFPLSKTNLMRFLERRELRHFVEDNDVDIIHAHDSHSHSLAVLLAKKGKPRILVTRRSSGKVSFGSRTKYLKHNIKYIAISNHIRVMLIESGIPGRDITVIHSMIDLSKFGYFAEKSGGADERQGRLRIISAGAFDLQKGFHDAVAAINEVAGQNENFDYILYGDGPEKGRLIKEISKNKHKGKISLPGWHPEPSEYLKEADIFVSTSYSEGLNMSIVEAMAAGAAVIATNIPPHCENIEHEKTGLLFSPGDREKLAASLKLLMENDELRHSLARNAGIVAEKYDSRIISEKIFHLYGEVIADRR